MIDLKTVLTDAIIMAPMTKGGNLPYRRLCNSLGATITMSEMVVAHQLLKGRRGEYALVRRAPDERIFGVQFGGSKPEEVAAAAAIAVERGADFVDLNCGCPVDYFTKRGIGSALLQRPTRLRRIVEAMRAAVQVPVTVKIRLGWSDDDLNYMDVARAAVDGGAMAITVHGRSRTQRYRRRADWDKIGEVVAALPVPVIGNGDILFPHEIKAFRAQSGCAGVMIARGALIKPWIFREAQTGLDEDPTPEERLAIYAQWTEIALGHFGSDERGRKRVREFLLWHIGFWCRHVPRRPDGTYPEMQEREETFLGRSELEGLLARNDLPAHEYLATRLMDGVDAAGDPPAPAAVGVAVEREAMPEG